MTVISRQLAGRLARPRLSSVARLRIKLRSVYLSVIELPGPEVLIT